MTDKVNVIQNMKDSLNVILEGHTDKDEIDEILDDIFWTIEYRAWNSALDKAASMMALHSIDANCDTKTIDILKRTVKSLKEKVDV